jgi:hypothetical protein
LKENIRKRKWAKWLTHISVHNLVEEGEKEVTKIYHEFYTDTGSIVEADRASTLP